MKKSFFWKYLPIAGYVVIILFLFFPVFVPKPDSLIFGDDIHRSYHFFRQFFHDAIVIGEFPWWNPYLFSGEPLTANPSVPVWYPFNWLFAVLPYRYVYSILVPTHLFIAMIGMYWIAKKWLAKDIAWVIGLIFGLSGFFMGRIWEGHIDIITSAPYVPIVFGLFWNAFEKKTSRAIVWASVFYALQMFAGYQTMAYFTGWAIGLVALVFCLKEKSLRPLGILLSGILLAFGLAALQIVPAQEFFRQSIRTYVLPYSWVELGASSLASLKLFIFPFLYGTPGRYSGPGPNYGELAGYVGIIPLVLAAFAVILVLLKKIRIIKLPAIRKYEEIILPLGILVIFSLWVSFAGNAPIDLQYILWKYIPIYHYLRVPSRHLVLFVFSASLLAGFGLSVIKQKIIRMVLLVVVVGDVVLFAQHFITLKPDPVTRHNTTLVNYLQQDKSFYRLLPNFNVGMATRDALDFDAAMAYKIFSASGYDPAILKNYYDFIVAANSQVSFDVQQIDVQIPYLATHSRYTDFLNIKYILVPSWFDSVGASDRFHLLLKDSQTDFWKLYENKSVLPRFFLVPGITVLSSREEVATAIRNRQYDPSETILTSNASKNLSTFTNNCTEQKFEPVIVISYKNNSVTLEMDAPCNAFLATSEVMYPGWEATIDGVKTNIIENNLAFRALYVPEGKHRIVFNYVPKIFYLSFLISIGTGLICLIWVMRSKKYIEQS